MVKKIALRNRIAIEFYKDKYTNLSDEQKFDVRAGVKDVMRLKKKLNKK